MSFLMIDKRFHKLLTAPHTCEIRLASKIRVLAEGGEEEEKKEKEVVAAVVGGGRKDRNYYNHETIAQCYKYF